MTLTTILTRLVLYTALFVGIYAAMAYDALSADFGESSLTEYTQEILLLLIAIISFYSARQHAAYRTFAVSLGALAVVSLIREFNNYAYVHLFPYAWQVGVLLVLLPFSVFLYRNFRRLALEITSTANSYFFPILLIGTLVLHVFSRLYGLHFIWQNLMGDNYMYAVVRASEESIELLGYSILFIGAVEFYLFARQRTKLLTRTIVPAPARHPVDNTMTVSVSKQAVSTYKEVSFERKKP